MGATPAERIARATFENLATDPNVWATHGLPSAEKRAHIIATIEAAILSAIREARADEREACARVADERATASEKAADSTAAMPARDRRDEEDYTRMERAFRDEASELRKLAAAVRARKAPT